MKRVVITGATSFLGRNVVSGLLESSYVVYAFVREKSPNLKFLPTHKNLHLIYGDLDSLETILSIVCDADVFLHFAWDGSGNLGRADEKIQEKNVEYALLALKIAEKMNCGVFVFPGSQAEYGINPNCISEKTECRPISPYGKAKLQFGQIAQRYCENKTIRFVHLRIFSVYGYGDRKGTLVDGCIQTFNHGGKMEMGACQQLWNYLYIDDFVQILLRIISIPNAEGIINVASENTNILKDYVLRIFETSNKTGTYCFGQTVVKPEGVPVLNPDITKLKEIIGDYQEIPFERGILSIMNKMKEMGE
jgi:nucleoside-diphosphate-sugar epimerase